MVVGGTVVGGWWHGGRWIVLPRVGSEYDLAALNSGSATLNDKLSGMGTWERVRAQAVGGELRVDPVWDAAVESHYPVRVRATAGANVLFTVEVGSSVRPFVRPFVRSFVRAQCNAMNNARGSDARVVVVVVVVVAVVVVVVVVVIVLVV